VADAGFIASRTPWQFLSKDPYPFFVLGQLPLVDRQADLR
jgi:hypothetical protein